MNPPDKAHLESVLDAGSFPLARAYADALMGLCRDNQDGEDVCGRLFDIAGLFESSGLGRLLTASLITPREIRKVLRRIFDGRVDRRICGLLDVMAANGRLHLWPQAARRFRELLNRLEGKTDVFVRTAAPMDEADKQFLVRGLRDAFGTEPILHATTDAALLGGMVVRVGDKVYDSSLSRSLELLRESLARVGPGGGRLQPADGPSQRSRTR